MRKIGLVLGLVALTAVGCGGAAEPEESSVVARPTTAISTPQGLGLGTGRHIVVFKSATLPTDAASRIANAGAKAKANVSSIGVAIVEGNAAAIAKLASDGAVAAVGPEHSWNLPKIAHKKKAAALASTAPDFLWGAQWDQRRIKANVAWNNVPASAQSSVTVAVLDTGVQSTHPDLAGKIVDSVVTSYAGSVFNCPGPHQPDPAYPFYFSRINTITGDMCEFVADGESVQAHGTHVAGTIAGNYGGGLYEPYGFPGGIVGVAPSANIAAYKVFDRVVVQTPNGPEEFVTATDYALFTAIADAASKGRAVINMSLGGAVDRTNPEDNASWVAWNRVARLATQKGTLIVAAAGNENANNNGSLAFIPSDLPGVVSVSATGSSNLQGGAFPFGPYDAAQGSDVRAFYSNFGAAVNLAAPGGDCGPAFDGTGASCDPRYLIVSSVPAWDPANGSVDPYEPGWSWYAGTSMAAPHVAGVAALVKAKNPSFTPSQIRARLEQTATPLGNRQAFGKGLVDADLATR